LKGKGMGINDGEKRGKVCGEMMGKNIENK